MLAERRCFAMRSTSTGGWFSLNPTWDLMSLYSMDSWHLYNLWHTMVIAWLYGYIPKFMGYHHGFTMGFLRSPNFPRHPGFPTGRILAILGILEVVEWEEFRISVGLEPIQLGWYIYIYINLYVYIYIYINIICYFIVIRIIIILYIYIHTYIYIYIYCIHIFTVTPSPWPIVF